MASLAANSGGLLFNDLKELCALTDGNLSRHLDVLAAEGLVKVTKTFAGRRPLTTCALTAAGRKRFRAYIAELEQVVRDAAAAEEPAPRTRPGLAGA